MVQFHFVENERLKSFCTKLQNVKYIVEYIFWKRYLALLSSSYLPRNFFFQILGNMESGTGKSDVSTIRLVVNW